MHARRYLNVTASHQGIQAARHICNIRPLKVKLFRTIVNVMMKQPGGLGFEPCVMCMWFYTWFLVFSSRASHRVSELNENPGFLTKNLKISEMINKVVYTNDEINLLDDGTCQYTASAVTGSVTFQVQCLVKDMKVCSRVLEVRHSVIFTFHRGKRTLTFLFRNHCRTYCRLQWNVSFRHVCKIAKSDC